MQELQDMMFGNSERQHSKNLALTEQEMLASNSQKLGLEHLPGHGAQNTQESFPSPQEAPCSLSTAGWGVLLPLVSLLTQLLY